MWINTIPYKKSERDKGLYSLIQTNQLRKFIINDFYVLRYMILVIKIVKDKKTMLGRFIIFVQHV